MGCLSFTMKGDFATDYRYLNKIRTRIRNVRLDRYAEQGLAALQAATPVDTGTTAASWYYRIKHDEVRGRLKIEYCNSNKGSDGKTPVAIVLQYGHATRFGGWVEGIDYINPAIQPIFKKMADALWKEVRS